MRSSTLFGLIRRFVTPTTGVIYISHRMHELSQISDRITVLRDGRYIDTLDTVSTTVAQVISLMVGRDVKGDQRPRSDGTLGHPVLAVRGCGLRRCCATSPSTCDAARSSASPV